MKKIITISSLFLFTGVFLVLVSEIVFRTKASHKAKDRIEYLPGFSFPTTNNSLFNSCDIKNGPLLIVHFNPECEHCKYETERITESDLPGMNCPILMITEAPPDSVKKFVNNYSLNKYPSIKVLLDTSYVFGKIFRSGIIPTNYIYNKNLQLVKTLQGEYKTETIIKYLIGSE
jgi:hypothetical protein